VSYRNGYLRGGLYRKWWWRKASSGAFFLIAPTVLTPGAAAVTVVANDATVVPGVATIVASSALVNVTANDSTLSQATPLTPASAVVTVVANDAGVSATVTLSPAAATVAVVAQEPTVAPGSVSLAPSAATVTVVAQEPTLTQGQAAQPPRPRRLQPAVRWPEYQTARWLHPSPAVTAFATQPLPPFAPPAAVVTVVANDAGLSAGFPPDVLPYIRLRAPALAPRWAAYLRERDNATAAPVAVLTPPTNQSLAAGGATVTVVANGAGISAEAPVVLTPLPSIHTQVTPRWSQFLRDDYQRQAPAPRLLQQTVLEPGAATVTVVANDAGVGSTVALSSGVAAVTVVANDAGITAAGPPASPPFRPQQLATRWPQYQPVVVPQRFRLRAATTPGPLQTLVAPSVLVTVVANDPAITSGGTALTPAAAEVAVVAQSPVLASSTALVPAAATVTVVAQTPALTVSAVALTPESAIVQVAAVDAELVGGEPQLPVFTGRRWWRRYYDFSGGGQK